MYPMPGEAGLCSAFVVEYNPTLTRSPMNFLGWINLIDRLGAHCPQCNRRMRNKVRCNRCRLTCCSIDCIERHTRGSHAEVIEAQRQARRQKELLAERLREEKIRTARLERAEAERMALLQAEEQERRARIRAARTKKEKLERIREEITKAAECLEINTVAWQRAGSPVIHQADVEAAQATVRKLQSVLKKERRKRGFAFAKMTYLRTAAYTRTTARRFNIPWFAPVLIFGAICFALTVVIVLPFTKGHTLAFSFGGIGFIAGLAFMLCVFFAPSDEGLHTVMDSVANEQQKAVEARKAAWAEYEVARDEYERLASLRNLRTNCDEAAQRKLHFEEEYRAVSAE